MINGIYDLINSTCKADSGCTTGTELSFTNINYAVSGIDSIQTGTLTITISEGHWTTKEQFQDIAMLAAQTFNATASGKNCEVVHRDVCVGNCGIINSRTNPPPGGGGGGGSGGGGGGGTGGGGGNCGKFSHAGCFSYRAIALAK